MFLYSRKQERKKTLPQTLLALLHSQEGYYCLWVYWLWAKQFPLPLRNRVGKSQDQYKSCHSKIMILNWERFCHQPLEGIFVTF